ncbi:LEAF RUST 10 DISEASE-RESISTANCE LOCUS RECEPTOR-LIKE PROTEIN KINASE-like 2.4 [Silene latifolia]|uniref:LEAF RUST 10 DISEASE-RESISTANCE LOCUS RECEPTOR-LIKE PROTEIN KINASE-like 2.4 n=1 Tax=Silene latifolia TaxID=37657 RepID=UPI003D786EB6
MDTTYIIFLVALTILPATQCQQSDEFSICSKTFNCGNITGLSYPFYGEDRPQYCGHPKFELLGCNQSIEPIHMMILSQKFYVVGINIMSSTMNVSREDYYKGSGCPSSTLTNITIDFSIFQYTPSDTNISLFYDCASKCRFYPCPVSGGKSNPVCFMTQKMMVQGNISGVICPNNLFLPVHVSDNIAMDEEQGYLPTASVDGFELKWSADNVLCEECLYTRGQCGHDTNSNKFVCFCPNGSNCPGPIIKRRHRKLHIVLLACFSASGVCIVLSLLLYVKRRRNASKDRELQERKVDVEAFLRSHGSSGPKRYTYTDLKKITNSFQNKLGQGGYGTVYKGRLQNGNLVAVKMLHKSKGDTEEFINEVASIGNTNHVNVVKLFGFCYSGHKRALVYEYMSNGSLEKFLFTGNNYHSLGLEILFEIAIGVARGLEYLHRGCNTRILHFDIKPHNILLDDNFCPKISDFGLAKSCPQKDSIILSISEARGTAGYIAPEVFLKSFGGVSHKSDVYSYGMLVLEMVGCRRKANVEGELSSEQHFPQWIYNQLEPGEETNQEGIVSSEEIEMQRKMIIVSLWCVQTNPSSRPAMSKVVEMLEGGLDLQIPAASALLSASLRSQH